MCQGEVSESVLDIDDGKEYSCKGYAGHAMMHHESSAVCKEYYQLIGHAKCCMNDETPQISAEEECSLCVDGSLLDEYKFNQFGVIALGDWDADVTCLAASSYVSSFESSSNSCSKYQELGVKNCGCPDLLPSHSPSMNPTFEFEKMPDCNALRKGIFPSIDPLYVTTTKLNYNLNLNLANGVSVEQISEPFQETLGRIVSVEAVEGCSSSEIGKPEDVNIQFVKFKDLKEGSTAGLVSGKSEVVYSALPARTRGRKLVDEEALATLISNIINEKSDEIALSIDGIEGLSSVDVGDGFEPDANDPSASRTSPVNTTGITVGISVSCTAVLLVAGYLVSKNKRMKTELPRRIEKVEFLPNENFLPMQVRSDHQGVECYPENYDLEKTFDDYDDDVSQEQMSTKLSDTEKSDQIAYGINEPFPIGNITSRDPFQDSDSSDGGMPSDEEWENKPITVRRTASYRVKDTMEL